MKDVLIMVLILAASATFGFCNLPADPGEYRQWELESLNAIKTQGDVAPDVAIPKLGSWLAKLSNGANTEGGDRPVFHAVQSALLAIPGHAKYYQDKIETNRELVKANENLTLKEKERLRRAVKPAVGLGDYERMRGDAFAVLAQLPSPETVAVLGHFLEDPEGRDGNDMLGNPLNSHEDVAPAFPNCGLACFSITNLGIEQAPISDVNKVNSVAFDPEQVDTWKDWWNEVKSGKRTYRFKGSAIDYGPDGPATKEQLERISVHQRMENDRATRHGMNSDRGKDTGSPAVDAPVFRNTARYAIIAAALAVLASIVWYFRRAKAAR